jgi:curved DNA-binding protein CbpA
MNPRPSELELTEDDLAALNSDPVPEDRWKYYTILRVPRTASTADIEQSYRRLSKIYHTDGLVRKLRVENRDITQAEIDRATASARLTMSLINDAKAVLTDPVRRAAYDLHGDSGLSMFESLDVAVRDSAKPSEVLQMLGMLKGMRRQRDVDVRLNTSGAAVVLVDVTDYVDVAVARWLSGERGEAQNALLPLSPDAATTEGFADVRKPFVKAVTVQHSFATYASEHATVVFGGAMQGTQGLSGACRACVIGSERVSEYVDCRAGKSVNRVQCWSLCSHVCSRWNRVHRTHRDATFRV